MTELLSLQTETLITYGFGLAVLVVLIHYPSVCLALFSYAYVLRGGLLLPGGVNLTGVFLIATVLGVLLKVQSGRKLRFRLSQWDLWVLMITIAIVLGTTYGDPDFAREKALRFVVLVSLPYFLARIVLVGRDEVNRFVVTIMGSSLVVVLLLAFAFLFPDITPDLIIEGTEQAGRGRFSFLTANSIPVGAFFMVGMALGLAQMRHRRPYRRLLFVCLIALFIFGTLLTGTRGAVIAALFLIGLVGTTWFVSNPTKATLLGLLILGMMLGFSSQFNRLPNWQRFESLRNITEDQTLSTRLDLQSAALDRFLDDPGLGFGTGGLRSQYPHNIFIELAAENGLIGLVPFALLVILLFGRVRQYMIGYRNLPPEQARIVLSVLLPLIGLLIVKQFSFQLTTHKDLFVFFGLAANLPYILSSIPSRDTNLDKTSEKEGLPAGEMA